MIAQQSRFASGVFIAVAVTVLLSILYPRSLGFLPALIGVVTLALSYFLDNRSALSWKAIAPFLIPAGIVVGLAALSAVWSINSEGALERAGKMAGVIFGTACLYTVLRTIPLERVARLWWILPAIVALCAVYLTSEYQSGFAIYRFLRGIPADQYVALAELNRSCVALILISLPTIGLLYNSLRSKGIAGYKAFAAVLALIALIIPILMMTDSQSAQLSFIAGLLAMALFPVKNSRIWVLAAIVVCAGVLLTPWLSQYLFSIAPKDVQLAHQSRLIMQTNYLPRLEIWDFVSRYALQSPWLGHGIEATRYVAAFDTQEIYQPGKTLLHPHNGALQIWVEFGALGAILAAIGLTLVCKLIFSLPDTLSRRIGIANLVAVMSIGVIGYGLWQGWWVGLLCFLIGISTLVVRIIHLQNSPSRA